MGIGLLSNVLTPQKHRFLPILALWEGKSPSPAVFVVFLSPFLNGKGEKNQKNPLKLGFYLYFLCNLVNFQVSNGGIDGLTRARLGN